LASPSRARRLTSAKWFLSLACKEMSTKWEACLMNPAVTERLVACIEREKDDKVKEAMVGALAHILTRYMPDQRAFPLITSLIAAKSATIRSYAIHATGATGFDQWKALVPLLHDPDKVVRASACGVVSALNKRDLQTTGALDGIIGLLEDRVPEVRFRAFHALLGIDARCHVGLLQAACEREKKRPLKKLMLAELDFSLNYAKQSRRV
jgi:HEAT repeats